MKHINVKYALALIIMVSLLSSCYKEQGPEYYDDLDVTLTYYNNTTDFSLYKTFVVRDSVGLFSDYFTDDDIEDFYSNNGASEAIKEKVKEKFEALGYIYVDSLVDADFAVNLFAAFFEKSGGYDYPIWWWDPYYYGYYSYYYPYYPGWGGGYYPGWYPWDYMYYSYNTGTVLVEMIDGQSLRDYKDWMGSHTDEEIENADPDEVPKLEFVWQAVINGILSNKASYDQNRLNTLIDEAYTQSPYLGR
ncbi:MAG: DUF4136 domain-containing protein [Bacteroidales bacterium]|nr:DUF4136 domain-containing protein [Bacteroidales bacterium]